MQAMFVPALNDSQIARASSPELRLTLSEPVRSCRRALERARLAQGCTRTTSQIETIPLVACVVCGSPVLEHDKFCRRCGVRQDCEARPGSRAVPEFLPAQVRKAKGSLYRPVSEPLVESVTKRLSANDSPEPRGRFFRVMVRALVSVPIWLIFVLLSPLDAYLAARTISKEV
jgi:hypothetical protein